MLGRNWRSLVRSQFLVVIGSALQFMPISQGRERTREREKERITESEPNQTKANRTQSSSSKSIGDWHLSASSRATRLFGRSALQSNPISRLLTLCACCVNVCDAIKSVKCEIKCPTSFWNTVSGRRNHHTSPSTYAMISKC